MARTHNFPVSKIFVKDTVLPQCRQLSPPQSYSCLYQLKVGRWFRRQIRFRFFKCLSGGSWPKLVGALQTYKWATSHLMFSVWGLRYNFKTRGKIPLVYQVWVGSKSNSYRWDELDIFDKFKNVSNMCKVCWGTYEHPQRDGKLICEGKLKVKKTWRQLDNWESTSIFQISSGD